MIPFSIGTLMGSAFTMALSIPMSGVCAASATSVSGPATVVATRALDPRTHADLEQAMRGEAFANASYRLYAEQARKEGLPAVARLFERAADVEMGEHFTEAAALIGLVGGDAANLREAIKGEGYESRDMYPRFAQQATGDGDTNAAMRFNEIARDEAAHEDAFRAALRFVHSRQRSIPAPPSVDAVQVPAGPPKVRSRRTKDNLDTAMHGEALAHARYTLYADHASAQGDPALARLFNGNATAELREHFAEQAILAGLVGTTRSNLTKAIAGERHESQTMYPTFAERAEAAGDTAAARLFTHSAEDEAGHARAFQVALDGLR